MLCFVFTSFFFFFFFYSCFFFFLLLHSGDKFVFYYIKNLVFMGLHEGMVFFPDFPSFNGEDKRVILQRYHKVYHSHDKDKLTFSWSMTTCCILLIAFGWCGCWCGWCGWWGVAWWPATSWMLDKAIFSFYFLIYFI